LFEETLLRINAKLRALLPADWLGVAGDKFRKTGAVLADYSREHIRPEERIDELPDLAWNRVKGEANEKHSQALVNFADEEAKKIANELARRTANDKVREAKASADKMEAEARLSQSNDLAARIGLVAINGLQTDPQPFCHSTTSALSETKTQNRLPHPAFLSRVGGFVDARSQVSHAFF
jgi:hypothetical protein